MMMNHRTTPGAALILVLALTLMPAKASGEQPGDSAHAIVDRALRYMRGSTSESLTEMTIHRPDFERTMEIRGWTRGNRDALFFIEAPPKDAGNGTLKKGRDMWTYNPRINRVIKLPPSMMSQGWMGSDFSNDDLSKTDSILEDYVHTVTSVAAVDGHKVYDVTAIPHETSPVVWGKQQLRIRDDGLLLGQDFFDEDMILVKSMTTDDITVLGGKPFPRTWIMKKADKTGRYTRLVYKRLAFDVPLRPGLFTLTSLKTLRP